jgi:cytoskeletal protein CcmA (bactofilin family)
MYDWSRFSKSGNRGNEDEPEAVPPVDAADLPPAPGAAPGARGQMPEANVTLTNRPAPAPAAPPPMPTPVAAREPVETVVGKESSIQGTIRSEHSIRIQGAAQGEIESKHAVYVEEGATVNAKVTASEITVSGSVDGQIFSTGRVEIKPTGHVTGEINAASLVMQEGAYFDGQMKMKNRGEPDDGGVVDREVPTGSTGRRLPGAAGSRNSVPSE